MKGMRDRTEIPEKELEMIKEEEVQYDLRMKGLEKQIME